MRSTFPTLVSFTVLTLSAALSALAAGCAAEAPFAITGAAPEPATTEAAQSSPRGRIGSHGMVLAGSPAQAMLSHIPMFAAPHDVQLLVSGTLSVDAGGPRLPATFSDRGYTFLPEPTSLDALRTGVTRELHGTVYLGNFEQGGRPMAGARFVVDHVVHQHVLVTAPVGEAALASPALGYVVFGSRSHAFAAHFIGAAPSFDEILAVVLGADAPSDAELAKGVIVRVLGSPDVAPSRIGRKTMASVADGTRTFSLGLTATLSCLTGPDFVDRCE